MSRRTRARENTRNALAAQRERAKRAKKSGVWEPLPLKQEQNVETQKRKRLAATKDMLTNAQGLATSQRLVLRWSLVRCSRFTTMMHVMIEDAQTGQRLLNWWPSNGTWTNTKGGKGKCDDVDTALYFAVQERGV